MVEVVNHSSSLVSPFIQLMYLGAAPYSADMVSLSVDMTSNENRYLAHPTQIGTVKVEWNGESI